jgi:hypothetical protein
LRLHRHIITYTLLFIAIASIWTSSNINWGKERYTRIIKVDGNGYYAYLPAIFIYQDLHFGFFDEIASKDGYQNMEYEYRYVFEGKTVNKYFAGTALAQVPFFIMAHLVSFLTGEAMDGYSFWYLVFINIASIFYLLLSCIIINKILIHFIISARNRAIVLITVVFGTNLFYYAVYEPSMSHVYSLAFISLFMLMIIYYFQTFRISYLLISALLLGIITLIRPVNVLAILTIPILAGERNNLKQGLLGIISNGKTVIFSILLFMLPLAIQLILYKIQTGSFLVYSYGEERFHFDQPHMLKMLFSYRKGLFVYSPVLLLSLAGIYFVLKKTKLTAAFWLTFFLLLTYLLSCWYQWFYGGSFGSRVYIEYFGLFAILLGILLENIKGKFFRPIIISVLGILIVYSIIQTYQYYAGIIHWSDMNRELYWEVFMKFKG